MEEPKLDVPLHTRYWQRCLKSLLPTHYESLDSSRILLASFILSAMDLLGVGPDTFTPTERSNIKNWFLHCQHASGGFCGSPNMKFPDNYSSHDGKAPWLDGAHLPITYFALMGLTLVDGLEEVKRLECLNWLRRLQREDGSFGEVLGMDGKIEGGRDMRYCYCAVVIRWTLMKEGEELENDIDIEKLVDHLRAGETYDGGISETALHEPHGGYAYCAIAALSLLGRLPSIQGSKGALLAGKAPGLTDVKATIRWLMDRQQNYIAIDEDLGDEDNNQEPHLPGVFDHNKEQTIRGILTTEILPLSPATIDECYYVGHNGRSNKLPDTCYSFWNCAALDILGQRKLITQTPIRRFLFEQTQYKIGGFGKTPGDPPDIYHSYLGLAALATMKEPVLKELDSSLCISIDAKKKIESFKRKKNSAPEFSIFDLLSAMARSSLPADEKDPKFVEMEKEKERLMAGATKLNAL